MKTAWRLALTLAAALAFWSGVAAYGLTQDVNGDGSVRTLQDYIKDYVDVPPGATDWKVFGATGEIEIRGKDADGYDYEYTKPDFPAAVRALDGREVTVRGFMFPLNETEKQTLFLFGPFPVSCPFHYHVGPSLVLEVHADQNPVEFSYEPVTMRGRLELVKDDPENSVFFRLTGAREAKE